MFRETEGHWPGPARQQGSRWQGAGRAAQPWLMVSLPLRINAQSHPRPHLGGFLGSVLGMVCWTESIQRSRQQSCLPEGPQEAQPGRSRQWPAAGAHWPLLPRGETQRGGESLRALQEASQSLERPGVAAGPSLHLLWSHLLPASPTWSRLWAGLQQVRRWVWMRWGNGSHPAAPWLRPAASSRPRPALLTSAPTA